jgi:hypothetical protein
MPGAVTPVCNACGVWLCWDVCEEEAEQDRDFWDAWLCRDCNGGEPMSLKQWRAQRPAGSVSPPPAASSA